VVLGQVARSREQAVTTEGKQDASRKEKECSDSAQLKNRCNSMDLVARFDVHDYSTVHGLMKCIIALIV
jgi:hypothetical protein